MSDLAIRPRTLEEWLHFLDRLNPNRICLGLERVSEVLSRLDSKPDCLVVEVAGTNGKGSTAALIAGACVNAGIKTGLYTSPHLYRFTERVTVDGQPVDSQLLAEGFAAVEEARGDVPLTYFEYTTLAALVCFARLEVKLCVLEVGLGGRLDAVNAVDADLAVITSIGFDHMALLGHSQTEIAREKAGIIKPHSLVITGSLGAEALKVVKERSAELSVPVFTEGEAFSFERTDNGGLFKLVRAADSYELKTAIPLVPGCCVGAALCALYHLQVDYRLPLNEEAVLKAVASVSLPGRMQVLSTAPGIILDVAHNVPAAEHLRAELLNRPVKGRRFACVGMLKDKDIEGVMQVMADCFERFYLVTLPTERGENALRLAAALKAQPQLKASVKCFQEMKLALSEAISDLNAEDELLIFGSFVTVSLAGTYFGLNK